MQRPITRGAEANAGLIFHIFAQDSASTVGAGKASVAFSSWACRYIRNGEAISGAITPEDITTIGTYAAPTANTNIRIKAVDNTNMIGVYEVQIHLDWANTTNACQSLTIYLTATGVAVLPIQIPLIGINEQDGMRAGLTSLPNAAAEAAGGLFTRGTGTGQINQPANGMIDVNDVRLLGTAYSTPTVAGIPNVNVKTWNDLTTVELPLVPTTAGRKLDVSAGGEAGLDWANIGSPTTVQNLSGTNIDVDQVVASVSGSIGSVTGLTPATVHADLDDIQARLPAALTAGGNMKADMLALNGGTQSAADLKDFADDGYDPSTNKVQGVVLTDTVTTYTGNTPQTGDVFPLASTEIADIKAKTDNLPPDPADQSLVIAATDSILSKLLKYAQLILRKDAAIGTDNATEKTAINADGGSGAGAFDQATDSQESIRDNQQVAAAAALTAYDPPTRTEATSDKDEILTAVADVPTNSELATALGTADDAVLAQVALVKAKTDNLPSDPADQSLVIVATDAIYARLGAPAGASVSADILTTNTRLTSARAGYLDNLNIGGNVASSAEAVAIQNNTRVVRVVPPVIEKPDSGTQEFRIELFLYDDVGNMEAPDSAPTISLVNQAGTDLSARLDSTTMALISTGRYRAIYTADVGDTLEQLSWAFSVVEGGATRIYGNTSLIVDTSAVDFTAADRTKLNTLHDTRIPGVIQPQTGDSFARLGVPAGASVSVDVAAVKSQTAAIESDTQDLQSRTPAALVSGRMDSSVGAMAANTLTASALATDTVNELVDQAWREAIADHSGVVGSTAEALAAAGSAGDPWVTALPGAYGAGSAGKIVGDNLNATVGSRASQTSVDDLPTNAELATALAAADDAVLAAIAALNNLSQANIRTAIGLASANLDTQIDALPTNAELATALGTADDAVLAAIAALNNLSQVNVRSAVGLASANLDTQILTLATAANLALAKTAIDAIKLKTDGLPSDPADASDIAGAFSTVNSSLSTIAGYLDTEIPAIKAKTDNLPASPAAVGSPMTLTSGERDAIAAAHEAFEIEPANSPAPAFTVLAVHRQMLGMAAGVTSGMGTVEGTVKNPKGNKNRIVADIDLPGNRTPTSWDNS